MSSWLVPQDITPHFAPMLREHVAVLAIDDEAIIYEEGRGSLHQLNPTAAVVCQLFDGQTTLETLIDDLAAAYEGERGDIASDVLAMTRELGRKGLLVGVLEDDAGSGEAGG